MSSGIYSAPAYKITLAGRDITPQIDPRLESLTLAEARNEEADQLDITLTDTDGRLAIPRKGVTLALALGLRGDALIDKGAFIVDEVTHSGPPDMLTIRARSAELTSGLRRRRDQSWHAQTLGDIVQTIAGRHGLQLRIDAAIAVQRIGHIDQSGESDIAFITRLGRHFDAVATVKNGALLFLPISSATNAHGDPLPSVTIDRRETQQHNYTAADRDSYSGVRATFENVKAATRGEVMAGADGNMKALPDIFASKDDAQKAAEAEWQRIERGTATLTLTLATGKPDLMPQSLVHVRGFKAEIEAITWLAVRVTHTLGGGGLLTALELETASQQTDLGDEKKSANSPSGGNNGGFWD